jgi:hypothetical protein
MAIRTGDLDQISAESFLTKENQVTHVDVSLGLPHAIGQSKIRLAIEFRKDPSNPERSAKFEGDQNTGTVNFVFYNWDNPLGSALIDPIKIGHWSQKVIYINLVVRSIDQARQVDLYVYAGTD